MNTYQLIFVHVVIFAFLLAGYYLIKKEIYNSDSLTVVGGLAASVIYTIYAIYTLFNFLGTL